MGKYKTPKEIVSAYNAGTPRLLPDGTYSNQSYVDDVLKYFWELKQTAS
jgi:hypothetical protein